MEEKWDAELLGKAAGRDTRKLWEEVFTEDSKAFLDYYDQWKMTENLCYGIYASEGELASMMQLNPYELQVMGKTVQSHYIIAVATKKAYRHRGLMRKLLKKSLSDMCRQRVPFVFLMPASEAIYRPFDFRYFYEMNTGMVSCESGERGDSSSFRLAGREDIPALVEFSSQILEKQYDFYTKRDFHYYEMLFAELESENGGILLAVDDETGVLEASIPFWGGASPEIREILCAPELAERAAKAAGRFFGKHVRADGLSFSMDGKKPIIMGRLVNAEAFLELFSAKYPMEIRLVLEDPFIKENSGDYLWTLSEKGSTLKNDSSVLEEGALKAAELGKSRAEAEKKLPVSQGRVLWVKTDAASLFEWLSGGKTAEELLDAGTFMAAFGTEPSEEDWMRGKTEEVLEAINAVNVCRAPFINEIV